MKTCPNCKELNGNGRTTCWNCHKELREIDRYYKVCPNCGMEYAMKEERCKQCDEELAVCARGLPESHGGSQGGEHWQYVLSVLIPLAGIIMGCLYLGRGEEEKGKNLLILSLILAPVFSLLLFFLLSFPGF